DLRSRTRDHVFQQWLPPEGQHGLVGAVHTPPLPTREDHSNDAAGRQNRPMILPSAPTSMASAAGTLGSPGMVMTSPQIATTNSAPADSRTSRTFTTWSLGAPLELGLVVKLYWVLAMQTGSLP